MTDPKIKAAVKRLCKRARWSTAGSHAAAIEAELLAARADGAWVAGNAADDALSNVWRNCDGTTKRGVSRLAPGLKRAHDVLRTVFAARAAALDAAKESK